MNSRSLRARVLLLSWFIAAAGLIAQTNSGELTGRVTDKSESVVPDARVLIRNTGTRDVRETLSNHEGYFVATFLPPGVYEVSSSAEGFMKAVLSGIRIEAGQRVNLSLVLDVGSVSESVTVSATAQQVNTEDAKVRHVIDSSQAQELPLNGRILSHLLMIVPGVAVTTDFSTGRADQNIRYSDVRVLLCGHTRSYTQSSNVGQFFRVGALIPLSLRDGGL